MSKIQLVVTDVDGTLVQLQQREVSDVVRSAVIAAENRGVNVVPVTGRPYETLKPVLEVLGFDSLCVVDNGATIRDAVTGQIIWSNWLETETVRDIVRILLPFSTKIDYAPIYDEHIPDAANELEKVTKPAPYVFSFFPTDKISEIEAALQKIEGLAYQFDEVTGMPHLSATQVTKLDATKFNGVEALRESLGASKQNTLAIGDGNNDVPLFENAGLKVAMGNATDTLKKLANHIVGTVDDDGFAEAMERFVLT